MLATPGTTCMEAEMYVKWEYKTKGPLSTQEALFISQKQKIVDIKNMYNTLINWNAY